jgi:queuine tRNA-ribosyltransferase
MTCAAPFETRATCPTTAARTGTLRLRRAEVQTPIFMPVGTQAAIRAMPPSFLPETRAQIILANTYHLHQRPGEQLIDKLGGLHRFMAVDVPILTDSGGFQVFSLKKKEISEEGVTFSFEIDGKKTFLSPERSMDIQQRLGSDIAMAFDECLPPDADRATAERSVDMTARWAARCIAAHTRETQSLFGIVQGGMHADLRRRSVGQITSLPFDGFAIGGLSVGEGPELMNAILGETMPLMPTHAARYLMGVGRPQDLVDGVASGIDMFDCVIPTRHARGGALYTFQGRIRITHARYRRDAYPIDTSCDCYTCKHFSRAYLHHLFEIGEVLGATLATIHNVSFFGQFMERMRASIEAGTFASFRDDVHKLYPEKQEREEEGEDLAEAVRDAKGRMAAPRPRDAAPSSPAPNRAAPRPTETPRAAQGAAHGAPRGGAPRQTTQPQAVAARGPRPAPMPVKPAVTHGGRPGDRRGPAVPVASGKPGKPGGAAPRKGR